MPASYSEIIEILENVNSVAGILLNSLLLYAIGRFSRPQLGTYKYLLTTFALLDEYLVIIHIVVHPRVLRVDNIHSIVSDTVFDDRRVTAFWIGCQSLPFTLLAIHFLYRYWYFLCMLATSGHDNSVALAIMVAEFERKYGKRIENSWILMDQWRDDQYDSTLIAITMLMNTIMICSLTLTCSFAILTFQYIRNSYKMSVQATELQRKLLVTLCAQSAIPILFVYCPYLICVNNSFLKIPGTIFHDMCTPTFTFFPVWDPVIVMLLFTDYRRGLIGLVRKPPVLGPTTVQVTTVVTTVSASMASSRAEQSRQDQ